jgi:hypothetical protein
MTPGGIPLPIPSSFAYSNFIPQGLLRERTNFMTAMTMPEPLPHPKIPLHSQVSFKGRKIIKFLHKGNKHTGRA